MDPGLCSVLLWANCFRCAATLKALDMEPDCEEQREAKLELEALTAEWTSFKQAQAAGCAPSASEYVYVITL